MTGQDWKPELVLSAKDVEQLPGRVERCSRLGLAEKNHRRHQAWYKRFLLREAGVRSYRRSVPARLVTAANKAGDGTLGSVVLAKLGQ